MFITVVYVAMTVPVFVTCNMWNQEENNHIYSNNNNYYNNNDWANTISDTLRFEEFIRRVWC